MRKGNIGYSMPIEKTDRLIDRQADKLTNRCIRLNLVHLLFFLRRNFNYSTYGIFNCNKKFSRFR